MTANSASFFASFKYNFGGQLVARMLSFGINFYLLRVVSKETLGVANVRLSLLYTTILFLVREPFRKSCLESLMDGDEGSRTKDGSNRQLFRLIKLVWLCPVVAVLIGCVLSLVWSRMLSLPDAPLLAAYHEGVLLFWLSACIETLAEPLWIISQKFHLVAFVAFAQSIQILLQRFVVALLLLFFEDLGLRAFSYAMVVSSCVYTLLFYWRFYQLCGSTASEMPLRSFRDVFPHFTAVSIEWERLSLVKSFFWHSIVKQLLTDGAQYVMTFFDVLDFGEQGIYDAIEKLGSIVSRIFLAPLEESAYVYFSQNIVRNMPAEQQNKDKFKVATKVLCGLLRCVSIVGLTVCVFGFSYSYLALHIYGGNLLSTGTGPIMLRTYCLYIFLLATNGITECFSFASMTQKQISQHQYLLMVFSLVYIVVQILLASALGGVGFILANCINMMVRIALSLRFIHNFYSSYSSSSTFLFSSPLWQLVPNSSVLITLLLSGVFTALSELIFCCNGLSNTAAHVSVGAMALVFAVLTVYSTDFELVQFVLGFLKPTTKKQQ